MTIHTYGLKMHECPMVLHHNIPHNITTILPETSNGPNHINTTTITSLDKYCGTCHNGAISSKSQYELCMNHTTMTIHMYDLKMRECHMILPHSIPRNITNIIPETSHVPPNLTDMSFNLNLVAELKIKNWLGY